MINGYISLFQVLIMMNLEIRNSQNKINQLGKDGWQLVDVEASVKDGTTSKRIYFFKRKN